MPLSGQAMSRAVTTIGAGILPGIIAPMAGIPSGTIPGTILLGMVGMAVGTLAGMIPGIMAGAIPILTTVITGLTPSIMVAATYAILHAIIPHVRRLVQDVTDSALVAARQQDVDPSVAAIAIVEAARQRRGCQAAVTTVRLVAAVLPAVQAPLVEVAALVVVPSEVAVAEAAQEVVADSDATGNV